MTRITELIMNWISARLDWLINWKYFTPATGIISLINPIAIVPQLYQVIVVDNVDGVSWHSYLMFIVLQIVYALIGIKAKNFLMVVSMIVSILICASIIIIVLLKT